MALRFVEELEARAATLIDLPADYTIVTFSRSGPVHTLSHGSYAIFYRRNTRSVDILHIRHAAQRSPKFD